MRRQLLLASVVLIGLIWWLFTPGHGLAAGPTVKVTQVDMSNYPEITVHVNVTDDRGKLLGGLAQTDFHVTEDNVPVTLADFAGPGDVRAVDIVFVFDTTTSMVEEVGGMKRTSLTFAEKLERSGVDYRLGLVDFGDVINRVEKQDGQLTDDAQQFKDWINDIRLAGGGYEIPEFSLGALQRASQMSFRSKSLRICILITDAPPHHYGDRPDRGVTFNDPSLTLNHTLQQVSDARVTAYVVAPEYSDYLRIVEETNGEFFRIHGGSDFTAIIDEIGGLIATQYRLSYVSPRPTYDGTRRNIEVAVGEAEGTATYLEQHLINIRSNGVFALLLLVPLLLALIAPSAVDRIQLRQPKPAAQPTPQPVDLSGQTLCSHCGQVLRSEAKFCSGCGQAVTSQVMQAQMKFCTHCGQQLRPDANFCNNCGQRQ